MRVSCLKVIRSLTYGACRLLRDSYARIPAGRKGRPIESNSQNVNKVEPIRRNSHHWASSFLQPMELDISQHWNFDEIEQRVYAAADLKESEEKSQAGDTSSEE